MDEIGGLMVLAVEVSGVQRNLNERYCIRSDTELMPAVKAQERRILFRSYGPDISG